MVWISGWTENQRVTASTSYVSNTSTTVRRCGPPRSCRRCALPLGPFIDPDDLHAGDRRSSALLHPAQNGVITDRQAEAAAQSFPRPSAEGVADHVGHDVRPTGSAAIDVRDTRQCPGEKANRARGLPTAPAADTHPQRHR